MTVPREVAVERVMRRNNVSAEEALKRVTSQMTNEVRSALALFSRLLSDFY